MQTAQSLQSLLSFGSSGIKITLSDYKPLPYCWGVDVAGLFVVSWLSFPNINLAISEIQNSSADD